MVNKRNDDVDTRLQAGILATETLDNLCPTLRDNHDGLPHDNQREDDEYNQYINSNAHNNLEIIINNLDDSVKSVSSMSYHIMPFPP